jgi:tetratricopeptide (TPR) repeat protein
MMERFKPWIRLMPLTIIVCIITGCASMPHVSKFGNPRTAYLATLYRGDKGREEEDVKDRLARAIVEKELGRLNAKYALKTLPDLRRMKDILQRPIILSLEDISDPILDKKQEERLQRWVNNNTSTRVINAMAYSPEWCEKLTFVSRQIAALTEQLASALTSADAKASASAFLEAMELCEQALAIDPSNDRAMATRRKVAFLWAKHKYATLRVELVENDLAQVAKITNGFGSDKSTLDQVATCLVMINAAQRKVDDVAAWCKEHSDPAEIDKNIDEPRRTTSVMAKLRGAAWAEKIKLLASKQRYWEAHEDTDVKIGASRINLAAIMNPMTTPIWHEIADYEKSILDSYLGQAYGDMLVDAMVFYVRRASQYREQQYSGVALVLCRMANEMHDSMRRWKFPVRPEIAGLSERLEDALAQTRKLLESQQTRYIHVQAPDSADASGQLLANEVKDEWIKRISRLAAKGISPTFWAVRLADQDNNVANDTDYLVACRVLQLYVDLLPSKDISVEDVSIGREIRSVPNPDRKQRKKYPHVYEQDVLLCVVRTTRISKRATFKANVDLTCRKITFPLVAFDEMFDGSGKQLPGVKLLDFEKSIDHLGVRIVSAVTTNDLAVEPLLAGASAQISPDREIRAAVLNYARDEIVEELAKVVCAYPIDYLLKVGIDYRKTGDHKLAADYLGRCFEYCYRLACMNDTVHLRTVSGKRISLAELMRGADWLTVRIGVAAQIAHMNDTVWRDQPEPYKAKMRNLWNDAVSEVCTTLTE